MCYVLLNSRIGAISVYIYIYIIVYIHIYGDQFFHSTMTMLNWLNSWFIMPFDIIKYEIVFDSDSRPSQSTKPGFQMGLPKLTTLKGPGLIYLRNTYSAPNRRKHSKKVCDRKYTLNRYYWFANSLERFEPVLHYVYFDTVVNIAERFETAPHYFNFHFYT